MFGWKLAHTLSLNISYRELESCPISTVAQQTVDNICTLQHRFSQSAS